jgi:SPP1 family predicted phage head-tail adaptor
MSQAPPISQLDRCITLQNETQTRGIDGSWKKTWATLYTTKAAYNYRTGTERMEASQEQGVNTCSFTVRYQTGITEKCRVVYDSENYDIVSVEEVGRKKYLVLFCVKKTVYQEQ